MKWISVKEKTPEINLKEYSREFSEDVLVKDHLNECWVVFKQRTNNIEYWQFKTENDDCCHCVCPNFYDIGEENYRQITHWMPLPEPPKDKE